MKRSPNIVWIISDDTDHAMLGYAGGRVLSPNIDSIAREGVVFERFHCVSAACAPSRYNYLTGHYGGRCPSPQLRAANESPDEPYKLFFNTVLEGDLETSLPAALSRAGYRTGHVGKWHVGATAEDAQRIDQFDPDDDPRDPAIDQRIRAQQEVLCQIVRHAGFDDARSVVWGNHQSVPRAARQHNIEWITKGALDFIDESVQRGQPFFLSMATTTIHGPNHVESMLSDPHQTGGGLCDEHLDCQPSRASIYERLARADNIPFNSTTAGVLWMDDAIGAVLQKLQMLGLADDTIVIYCADHGPSRGGKFTPYTDGTHIPLAIRWPRQIEAGRTVSAMTQNVDLVPTLLDLAGVEVPADMVLDGRSLVPLLRGEATEERDDLYFEFGHARAVATDRYKYIAWRPPPSIIRTMAQSEIPTLCMHYGWQVPSDILRPTLITATLMKHPAYFEPDQLYDLHNDPGETVNLAADPDHASVLQTMRRRLGRYLEAIGAPFPLDGPDTFLTSDRFAELKSAVFDRIERETPLWESDARYVGFLEDGTSALPALASPGAASTPSKSSNR